MVSESTWRVPGVLRFILARNYNGFVVDMDSLYQAHLHFSEELQCFRGGHGFCETVRSEPDRNQIGIRCSVTQKCSQRFEIDHFCWGKFSAFQSSKNWYESNRGSFRFTHSISDILIRPSWSLRIFRNWRLVCCELRVDTDFEIYGSSIGVCN